MSSNIRTWKEGGGRKLACLHQRLLSFLSGIPRCTSLTDWFACALFYQLFRTWAQLPAVLDASRVDLRITLSHNCLGTVSSCYHPLGNFFLLNVADKITTKISEILQLLQREK